MFTIDPRRLGSTFDCASLSRSSVTFACHAAIAPLLIALVVVAWFADPKSCAQVKDGHNATSSNFHDGNPRTQIARRVVRAVGGRFRNPKYLGSLGDTDRDPHGVK